jgi:DNA (cytosine-5)-methyltransferase 1
MKNPDPKLLMVDLYCGAGGTSTGAQQSGVCKVVAAVNHDPLAIESHAANHPDILHLTEDTRLVNVAALADHVKKWQSRFPNAKLILWASLECTNFSNAKGGLPRDADSRTLAEDLPRYVTALNPDYVMIENVREFMSWGDLDENNRPVSKNAGKHYIAWRKSIEQLGYGFNFQMMNSADFSAYTSRVRFFGCFAKNGLPIVFPEPTHERNVSSKPSLFGAKQGWKPVIECLDLQNIGSSVFGKKRPLVPKTIRRILEGLKKFANEPLIMTYTSPGYCAPLSQPAGVLTTACHKALVTPLLMSYYGNSTGCLDASKSPCPTLTTKDRMAMISPSFCTAFFGNPETNPRNSSVNQPSPTITAQPRQAIVFVERQFSSGGGQHNSISQPLGALPTVPKARLCSAFLVNPQFRNQGASVHKPAPTIVAAQKSYPLGICTAQKGESKNWEHQSDDSPEMRDLRDFMRANGISDVFLRMLNVPELKKIQGFPADYVLAGSTEKQKKFIGNSVVPAVVKAWMQTTAMTIIQHEKHLVRK